MERRAATPPTHRYEATGDSTSAFLDLAHRLIGPEIPSVELVQTGAVTIPDHVRLRQENA
jgi:glutamate racemase